LRAGGDGGRPAASVKSAAAVVARAREKEKRKKSVWVLSMNLSCQSDWRDWVAPQQMARLVDMRHKMACLPVVSSAVTRLSHPSQCGTTSAVIHASAPLVASVRLARLLYKSHQMNWCD
jgi:hypothetical protein